MFLVNISLAILIFSGFNLIGKKISINFKSISFFKKVVNLDLLNIVIGLSVFLLIVYPLILFKIISLDHIKFFLIILFLLGVYNVNFFINNLSLLKNIINSNVKNINFGKIVFIFIFILYFLISISPITDADSAGYHLFIPNYFINFGYFPIHSFNYQTYLFGVGEILNLMALIFRLEVFISLTNFLGLLILLSIINNLIKLKSLKYYYYLLILSCPILIPLVNTAKPQLLFLSIIGISFSMIIHLYKKKVDNEKITSIFIILCVFGIFCYLAKTTFALSYFFSIVLFFIYIIQNFNKKIIYNLFFYFLLINTVFVLPVMIWKIQLFETNYLKVLFNPIPDNPGMEIFIQHIQNWFNDRNLITFIFPLNFSDLTNTFGPLIFIIPLIFYISFKNKNYFLFVIISFIIIVFLFGQRTPRFFLEIYFLSIFILSATNYSPKRLTLFKNFIILQSLFTSAMIAYGVLTLIPGQFNAHFKQKVFLNYSNGYSLYKWANNIVPKNEKLLTSHRSVYFSHSNPLFMEFSYFLDPVKSNENLIKYYLDILNKEKPKYILFWDSEIETKSINRIDFKNCLDTLLKTENKVGFHTSRNPLNFKKKYYPASVYKLVDDVDLNKCTIFKG